MKNELVAYPRRITQPEFLAGKRSIAQQEIAASNSSLPGILILTSYPPRECGIATYSQDLLKALDNKFSNSFSLKVCALEAGINEYTYPDEVKYVLDTTDAGQYIELANTINSDNSIMFVVVQHEFGFFQEAGEEAFPQFLYTLTKSAILVFHTVLPKPDAALKEKISRLATACAAIVVMTKTSQKILKDDYGIPTQKVEVIAHGTHLVPHLNKDALKEKHGLTGRKVLSTFGLLSSGKSIETTLDSLPAIIESNPDALFLVIGKTHPSVVKSEGEKYRDMLEAKVEALSLQSHVKFINRYLPLQDLLEYLQMTDIYLFTSKDRHQAVSGTFSYAMSCGCPIISTPIPHAKEVLRQNTGILVDFQSPQQLADAVNRLMGDELLRSAFSTSTLQRIVPTSWENSAIAHASLLQKLAGPPPGENGFKYKTTRPFPQSAYSNGKISLEYRMPGINLAHVLEMTTEAGIIQFSKINQPDLDSGYTLDDNARALVALLMHYEWSGDRADLGPIRTYLNFIEFCQQPTGDFLNYVDSDRNFTPQNNETNLSDANGRAIWALGYLVSKRAILPADLLAKAENVMQRVLPVIDAMHSTRSMAFSIKGLYYFNQEKQTPAVTQLIQLLGNRLLQMYRHESAHNWKWYEDYLTYANAILPEAMLCAWQATGNPVYKETAKASLDFLLSLTFKDGQIKVISNIGWMHKGRESLPLVKGAEQPIDIAYTILALERFYHVFKDETYAEKMAIAFNWFLGNNHLHQIIYNPCTGGCYDGLEERNVNLNQGAESTLSYLMARMCVENYR
ncbi:MAG: glycosyltransferase [Haliscomenobacter sp.]|nr:glycosyltransferase [Haliscomenobacter sp.]